MANLKLSAPWYIFYKEVNAMFEYDSEVKVIFDEENMTIKLFVVYEDKADALSQILPEEKDFGSVKLKIEVVPPNEILHSSSAQLFERALIRNEALSFVEEIKGISSLPDMTYVVFAKRVVQYYTDNLGDLNGMASTLYQNIADDIFVSKPGVFFCTAVTTTNSDRYSYANGALGKSWP